MVSDEVDETDDESSVGDGDEEDGFEKGDALTAGGLDTSCPLAARYLYLFTHV